MIINQQIALIGGGKMGLALLRGWLNNNISSQNITVIDPTPSNELTKIARDFNVKQLDKIPTENNFSIIVIAIKPQIMSEALIGLNQLILNSTLVISIAAGKSLDFLNKLLAREQPIIRAMPNIPAAIGCGITAICANKFAENIHIKLCNEIFSCVGDVIEVKNENDINIITAISGSGPAYIFLMAECIKQAGQEFGLTSEVANKLARKTIYGAGAMLEQSEQSSYELRESVTSPGGTTQAAIEILQKDNSLLKLIENAIKAARNKSIELSD